MLSPRSLITLGLVAGASCATIERRQSDNSTSASSNVDPTVLGFALILEHLENAFYSQGLANYSAQAFQAAGYQAGVRANIQTIAADEASHVALLTSALSAAGATPPQACTYNFGVNSVSGFLAVAQVLEGVGVSAYSGAAPLITSKDYLEVAANILTVEARHNAFIRLANGKSPFPAPYDVGISPSAVVTLAAGFFASCPSGSAPSFKPFPALSISSANVTAGSQLSIKPTNASAVTQTSGLSCAFASGQNTATSAYSNGQCQVPASTSSGQVYVYLIQNGSTITDSNTVAGPAIIDLSASNNTLLMANQASSTTSSNGAVTSQAGSASALAVSAGGVLSLVFGLVALFA